ncbi:MAG: ABC transporter substrate-binding protein [Candidatus Binatia bacterium]
MKKIITIFALCTMLLALSFPSEAQQAVKVPRVAYLASRGGLASNREAFRQGLRELGYVEGQNIAIEYRYAEKADRFPELASELARLKVDVLVAASTPAVLALKQATATIPIVFAAAPDPVGGGLVSSLARPGGNITGLSSLSPELSRRRLALFKETFSEASRVGVVWDPTSPIDATEWTEIEHAARALGMDLLALEVRGPKDIEPAFQSAISKKASGLIVLRGFLTNDLQKRIVDLALKNRMPAIYNDQNFTEVGGLMSYSPNLGDLFRRAALYVDKILKGAKPGDLSMERPIKFDLVINLKTAKQIGVTIPPNVLARADKVIK